MPQTKKVYIHGFDRKEQRRLVAQARFLERRLFEGVDFGAGAGALLEVGCGVGAQTKILLNRFPEARVTGVDMSDVQLETAAQYLKKDRARVELLQGDATNLPKSIKAKSYDGAFTSWFFEHVPDPLRALVEIRGKLKPGATLFCTEVFNQTLFVKPESPATMKFWTAFNEFQASQGGHPYLGGDLGNLLKRAGYRNIRIEIRPLLGDQRDAAARAKLAKYFADIFLSAAPQMLKAKRVTPAITRASQRELNVVARGRDSVFFYACVRAVAQA